MFVNGTTGALVDIAGTDPRLGDWHHKAFVPAQLPEQMPELWPMCWEPMWKHPGRRISVRS